MVRVVVPVVLQADAVVAAVVAAAAAAARWGVLKILALVLARGLLVVA